MNTEDIMPKLTKFVGQYVNISEITNDLDLFASGRVNSLFAMQLVLFVEKEFGFKVENEDLDYENFKSIDAILGFIQRKLAAPAA
ncbi:MAG: acyl carrier protein [Desulfamplus sp.]|nr:acyl carrier protein [Desulfamplus sp.]MBF0210008.1 acyl carrier protein [Desulfamplus sp.]MBF0241310.1 acyl carrier protein [Desulfamplus sp.]MBF0389297.1 acyl carrier protein [Desulfamplus sp.]